MAEVVLFHHAQGLTPGIVAFADELRAAGHTVHTPDLFEGRTFDRIAGRPGVHRGRRLRGDARAWCPAGRRPAGGARLRRLLVRRPAGAEARPDATRRPRRPPFLLVPAGQRAVGVRAMAGRGAVQIHGMDADPIFVGEGDVEAAREVVATAEDAELFLYPGDEHYFADSSLPSYDPAATALLTERMKAFLART